jgi:hypothetical protein
MLGRSTSARWQDAAEILRVPCQWRFLLLEEWTSDLNSELTSNVTVLPHPPYYPDLSPCYFFLFPRLKKMLKGRRHENIEAIQAAATMELTDIPKEAFTSCFQDLQKRWQQCISCEDEFGIIYRPSLRTLRTKDVHT